MSSLKIRCLTSNSKIKENRPEGRFVLLAPILVRLAFNLNHFILPVVKKAILYLVLGGAVRQFAFTSGKDFRDRHRLVTEVRHHYIVNGFIGVQLGRSLFSLLGEVIFQLADDGQFVRFVSIRAGQDSIDSLDGSILHNSFSLSGLVGFPSLDYGYSISWI